MELKKIKVPLIIVLSSVILNLGYHSLKNKNYSEGNDVYYTLDNEYQDHGDFPTGYGEVEDEEDLYAKKLIAKEILELDDSSISLKPKNIEYTIKKGDTLSGIAKRYNTNSDYLIINNLDIDLSTLKIGKTINIPSSNGIFYKVQPGESFSTIESKFNVKKDIIRDDNDIKELKQGETLFLREPKLTEDFKNKLPNFASSKKNFSTGVNFTKPLPSFVVTSSFGVRNHPVLKRKISHSGVDLKAPNGTKVMAAESGVVKFAGYSGNYGYLVVMTHANGYETRYAHLSKISVKAGQKIEIGKVIALSGSSGRVTGPHLHFELRRDGKVLNPTNYIKS